MKRNEFTLKMKKFVDAPFAMGDKTKGWDCLNYLREFYESIGKEFPKEFKGVNWENYVQKWESGEGKKIYKEFLLSLGISINPNYAIEGDLFVFVGRTSTAFGAIYLGRGHLTMVFDVGCRILSLKAIKALYGEPITVRRL